MILIIDYLLVIRDSIMPHTSYVQMFLCVYYGYYYTSRFKKRPDSTRGVSGRFCSLLGVFARDDDPQGLLLHLVASLARAGHVYFVCLSGITARSVLYYMKSSG